MLQIATGKLFTRDIARTNELRGTIYTNATFPRGAMEVPLATGRLLPPSSARLGVKAVAYEFAERIELEPNGQPGILISSTESPYTLDFATVCSFALNCICSPDHTLVQRLTSTQPGVSTGFAPAKFIERTFDTEFTVRPDEVEFLQAFTEQLIGLPRVQFLGGMRAIRTYVTAIHRIADDLELAYTLFVAALESLAQQFDGHQGDWASVEDRKRNAIDAALVGAPEDVAQRVREAMLSIEHSALSRRFREFTIAHTSPSFFRGDAVGVKHPSAMSDLEECLREAYVLRSKYVHSLKKLPHLLTMGALFNEVVQDGASQYFTITGLARLTRHVIANFVMQQQTVEREPYNYFLERHGIVQVPLSPAYWVGNTQGDVTKAGRDRLKGFLQQLASVQLGAADEALTDMRPLLEKVIPSIHGITRELRLPYLTLIVLFNSHVAPHLRVPLQSSINNLINRELSIPSSEALFAHCLTGNVPDWPLGEHVEALDGYFRRRSKGLRAPRLFEAAIILDLAERFRLAGDYSQYRRLTSRAVETDPGNQRLVEFEASLNDGQSVNWKDLLLPPREVAAENQAEPGSDAVVDQAQQELPTSTSQEARQKQGARIVAAMRNLASKFESR